MWTSLISVLFPHIHAPTHLRLSVLIATNSMGQTPIDFSSWESGYARLCLLTNPRKSSMDGNTWRRRCDGPLEPQYGVFPLGCVLSQQPFDQMPGIWCSHSASHCPTHPLSHSLMVPLLYSSHPLLGSCVGTWNPPGTTSLLSHSSAPVPPGFT